jgi:hypothetical protein
MSFGLKYVSCTIFFFASPLLLSFLTLFQLQRVKVIKKVSGLSVFARVYVIPLIVTYLVKKFPDLYKNVRFVTVLIRAYQWTLPR